MTTERATEHAPESTFGARLARYIGTGKRMSIRGLAETLTDNGVPGASRQMVHHYLDGTAEPPLPFITAAADLLHVRPEWLAFNSGEPTDTLIAAATVTQALGAAAGRLKVGDVFEVSGSGATRRSEAADTIEAVNRIAPALTNYPAAQALFISTWDRVLTAHGSPTERTARLKLATQLWRQIAAPLALFNVAPEAAPEMYYVNALGALLTVPAQGTPVAQRRK